MAGRAKDILLKFIVDDSQKSKLRGIGDQADKSSKGFSGLAGSMKVAALAGGAIVATKIVDFLGDATMAAAEDQKSQELLKLALENSTGATEGQIEATEKFIDSTARASGVADDELRPALAELARTTGDAEEAQDLLGIAMDIAAAKGVPLETVTKAIGKAALGNVGALGRMGIATKTTEGKVLSFEEAMAEANRTMGGAAEEAAATGVGSLARLQVMFDELKEALGDKLLPVLVDATDGLLKFMEELDTPGTQSFFDGLITKFGELHDAGKQWEDIAKNPVTDELGKSFRALGDMIGVYTAPTVGHLSAEMDIARHAADKHREATDDLTDASDDLAGGVDGARTALEKFEDEVKSQTDPLYALAEAEDAVTEALAGVKSAQEEFGIDSPEYTDALLDVAQANDDLTVAQLKVGEQSKLTRSQYQTQLEAMGNLTADEIAAILREFDRIQAFKFSKKTIPVNWVESGRRDVGQNRASGGPVGAGNIHLVGERGPELFIPSSDGTIIPNHRLGGRGGSGGDIHLHVHAETVVGEGGARKLAVIMRDELVKLGRRNGSSGL